MLDYGVLRAQDEPLFGLECQESARYVVPFFLALLTFFWLGPEIVWLGALCSVNERLERVLAS